MTSAIAGQPTGRFLARVIAGYGSQYLIAPLADAAAPLQSAVRRGKRHDVVVGDIVACSPAGDGAAAIESIETRRSLLFRADRFRTKELAANIDLVAVVFAAQPAFNPAFIWRALVAARAAAIDALVILNKNELADDAAVAMLDAVARIGTATLRCSAKHDGRATRAQLAEVFSGRATLFVGQSGMGKSTLLNLLVPEAQARTQEFSQRLNLGKQTTTASRSFDLPGPGGGTLIDMPGFQQFGLGHLGLHELAAAMPDVESHLGACRFTDCRHLDEPIVDCAVRSAVAAGSISADRYAFYRLLATEAMTAAAAAAPGGKR